MLATFALSTSAHGQRSGYQLALDTQPSAVLGEDLVLAGTAFETRGYAELASYSGPVTVRIQERTEAPRGSMRVVAEETVQARGAFVATLPVPSRPLTAPSVQVVVGERTFNFPLRVGPNRRLDLLLDRRRYEPGEAVQVWTRLTSIRTGVPQSNAELRVRVQDGRGTLIHEHEGRTDASGTLVLPVTLPESAAEGSYSVQVQTNEPVRAQNRRSFTVGRRTVERLMAELSLEEAVLPPTGRQRGRVFVRTPSGTPVAGASVQVRGAGAVFTVRTGRDGSAPLRFQAPAYAGADVVQQTVTAEANHPAYGSALAQAVYVLSRVPWQVEIRAEGGGIVPETRSRAYLMVRDPLGAPAPAGMVLEVRGDVISGGRQRVVLDSHGLAELNTRANTSLATTLRSGPCSGRTGASVQIEWLGDRPLVASGCVPIAEHALVRVATPPLVRPGSPVRVELERRASVRRRPVLVEGMLNGRVIASTFATGASVELPLPPGAIGRLVVRARPISSGDDRPSAGETGEAAFGAGSLSAVLIRPQSAFNATLESAQERWQVRETATLSLDLSNAPERAWVGYVVRDLAAHGGEVPWTTAWLDGAIREAVEEMGEDGTLLLSAALAAGLSADSAPQRPAPLVAPPWGVRNEGHRHSAHDAIFLRGEMRTRRAGQLMAAIERATDQLLQRDDAEGVVARGRFTANAIAELVRKGVLPSALAKTLGDEIATVEMLRALQSDFNFSTVARRLARRRLVTLLAAVVRFSNPDDEGAARMSAGYAPEDWLSRMIERGIIDRRQLIDPWGNAFALRRASSPRFVLSPRALGYELVSAGPDGRFGTGDDIDDPFVRAIAEDTPYSVASGEDAIMRQLSMLAPGARTLAAMAEAYASVDLRAREESRASAVRSTRSEGMAMALGDTAMEENAESFGIGGLGLRGAGRGGGGSGYGRGVGAVGRARARPAAEPTPAPMDRADRNARGAEQSQSLVFNQMADVVREEFPATLHFEGAVPLDGTHTNLSVPLQDALTTYIVEAIVWSDEGWLTTAKTLLRVDQDATIDGPVPPFGAVGDRIRLPLRVENRTAGGLDLQVRAVAEDIEVSIGDPARINVAARSAEEISLEVELQAVGSGHLRLEVTRPDGTPLDAVRRPLTIWPDAATVRRTAILLAEPGQSLTFDVPADASPRGPADIRVSPASMLFGDPADYAADSTRVGWMLALAGDDPGDAQRLLARQRLRANDDRANSSVPDSLTTAESIAIAWPDTAVSDVVIERALRALSASAESDNTNASTVENAASRLLAFAPIRQSATRPDLVEARDDLILKWRRASEAAVSLSDSPAIWAHAAFALAATGETQSARELMRRANRTVIEIGDERFLERQSLYGTFEGRIEPSAYMAGAHTALGERDQALSYLRHLATASSPASWQRDARLSASAVAHFLAGGRVQQTVLRLDGSVLELQEDGGVFTASSDVPGQPGTHRIDVQAGDAPALVFVRYAYGRPWDASGSSPLRVDLQIDGDVGARDRRAGLALRVQNREARLLGRPIVHIDLPAGAELEEDARERLRALSVEEPTLEGRTLRLALAPLAPGALRRIPLPIRWSTGGALHGLGVTLVDGSEVSHRIALEPSRVVEVPDRGEVPDLAEESSEEGPPPPRPDPIPLERISPFATLHSCSERSFA